MDFPHLGKLLVRKKKGFHSSPEDLLGLRPQREETERLLKLLESSRVPVSTNGGVGSWLSRNWIYSLVGVFVLSIAISFILGRWSTASYPSGKEVVTTAEVSKEKPSESPEAKKVRELRERLREK